MLAEISGGSNNGVVSATERLLLLDLKSLSPVDAGNLAATYFNEEHTIFKQRFVSLRNIVPEDVRIEWDKKAEYFAGVVDALEKGDARLLKEYMLHSGMEVNRQALNNPADMRSRAFGKALYRVGQVMLPSIASTH